MLVISIHPVGFPEMTGPVRYMNPFIMLVVTIRLRQGCFFGLILFNLLLERKDAVWGFGRFEKDGIPIRGTTYFIINNPPSR
jgi:hypothetical protein